MIGAGPVAKTSRRPAIGPAVIADAIATDVE